jgi:molecular chaperone GrpE
MLPSLTLRSEDPLSTRAQSPASVTDADFAVDIGDDVLAAALAAVEARTQRSPALSSAVPDDLFIDEVAADAALGGLGGDLAAGDDDDDDDGIIVRDGPSADAFDALTAELEDCLRLLDAARVEATEATARATAAESRLAAEQQERLRVVGVARRLQERAERAEAVARTRAEALTAAEERATRAEALVARHEDDLRKASERRRREVEEARIHGLGPALLGFLPVADHLSLALGHADADPAAIVAGVRMVADELARALEKAGARRVDARAGTPFSPEVHEALQALADDSLPPGTVAAELASGWTLGGRLLRAARVAVVAAPPAPPAVPVPDDGPPSPS